MFGSFLLFAATVMHVYVFWRAASVPFVNRRVPRGVLVGAGAVLWACLVIGRVYGHGGTGALAVAFEWAGMHWLAMLFLTCVSLLAADLLTGFGFLLPRVAPSLRGIALVAAGVLSVVALVQGLRPPAVEDYEVRLPGLPEEMDGTVLVAISDLHLGSRVPERRAGSRRGSPRFRRCVPTWWSCWATSSKGTDPHLGSS